MKKSEPYVPPTVTIDGICLAVQHGRLGVVLIKRPVAPLKNYWALPGGYVAKGETTRTALDRILHDKAGLSGATIKYLEQLYTFDWIGKDPRGHAVTVTYLGLCTHEVIAHFDGNEQIQWFPFDKLPRLAFDHIEFIKLARRRLASKLQYSNIAFGLLPTVFTMLQLQEVYEAILGINLDKRNFRRQIIATQMVQATGKMTRGEAHRPAHLYKFKRRKLTEIQRFLSAS